jgi:hypothetical protein
LNTCQSLWPDVPPLTIKDECDADCTSQALVRVVMPSGLPLDFCRHDYRTHELALMSQGARVVHVVPILGG